MAVGDGGRETWVSIGQREIKKIAARGQPVTTHLLVDLAKKKGHPLHGYFDWNDGSAAHKYRLEQAMKLIQLVRSLPAMRTTEVTPGRVASIQPVRSYLPTADGYRKREDALAEPGARSRFVSRKRAELLGWCQSVVDVEELQTLREAILEVLSRTERGDVGLQPLAMLAGL